VTAKCRHPNHLKIIVTAFCRLSRHDGRIAVTWLPATNHDGSFAVNYPSEVVTAKLPLFAVTDYSPKDVTAFFPFSAVT